MFTLFLSQWFLHGGGLCPNPAAAGKPWTSAAFLEAARTADVIRPEGRLWRFSASSPALPRVHRRLFHAHGHDPWRYRRGSHACLGAD